MLRIPRTISDGMVSHALQEFPIESCGILGGREGIAAEYHRVRNLKASPEHFLMDPREQIAVMESFSRRGLELLAFCHSHPRGPVFPSAEDIRLAFYPEVTTIIISLANPGEPLLRAFRINDGRAMEADLEIVPG